MPKRLLIIKASKDVLDAELAQIAMVAKLYDIDFTIIPYESLEKFKTQICNGDKFDHIYLGTHANPQCFGEADGTCTTDWGSFAGTLCELGCLGLGSVLFLGCCRGGLKSVANTLFFNCTQIDYVCGPRWTVTNADITAGFHVFLYNMEMRREQPSTAAERASKATGYDFFCYDRVETEDAAAPISPSYY